MEPYEMYQQESLEPSERVPASLLANVMGRLEQRKRYLSASSETEQERSVALNHPQWEIRTAAVRALGSIDEPFSRDLLLKALQDEHRLVRAAAVCVLGRLREDAPLDILLHSMYDPAWEVREMATLALSELVHQKPDMLKFLPLAAQSDNHIHVHDGAASVMHYSTPSDAASQEGAPDEVPARVATRSRSSWSHIGMRYSLIFLRQAALIHRSIWVGTLLLLLVWSIHYLPIPFLPRGDIHNANLFLALLSTVSTATSTAFIFGGEHDSALELTLSTPTSLRLLMFSRFLLVVGYNILLAASASALVALLNGASFWATIHLWFGPLILLSSFTLTLSLLIGSWFAICAALLVEFSQTVVFQSQQHWLTFDLVISQHWQTSPVLLILALGLLVVAALYVPQQPRLGAL